MEYLVYEYYWNFSWHLHSFRNCAAFRPDRNLLTSPTGKIWILKYFISSQFYNGPRKIRLHFSFKIYGKSTIRPIVARPLSLSLINLLVDVFSDRASKFYNPNALHCKQSMIRCHLSDRAIPIYSHNVANYFDLFNTLYFNRIEWDGIYLPVLCFGLNLIGFIDMLEKRVIQKNQIKKIDIFRSFYKQKWYLVSTPYN